MANEQAAGQSAVPEAGERPLAVNGDQRLLQALTTEHFTLQTARSGQEFPKQLKAERHRQDRRPERRSAEQ